jgi:hypothetical protein
MLLLLLLLLLMMNGGGSLLLGLCRGFASGSLFKHVGQGFLLELLIVDSIKS